MPFDGGGDTLLKRRQDCAVVFGVEAFGQAGRTDDVTEEHGDLASLGRLVRDLEAGATLSTEPHSSSALGTTARADHGAIVARAGVFVAAMKFHAKRPRPRTTLAGEARKS